MGFESTPLVGPMMRLAPGTAVYFYICVGVFAGLYFLALMAHRYELTVIEYLKMLFYRRR